MSGLPRPRRFGKVRSDTLLSLKTDTASLGQGKGWDIGALTAIHIPESERCP